MYCTYIYSKFRFADFDKCIFVIVILLGELESFS